MSPPLRASRPMFATRPRAARWSGDQHLVYVDEFAGSFVQARGGYHRVNEERRSQCAGLSMWRRIFLTNGASKRLSTAEVAVL